MLHFNADIWCHITSHGAPRISIHYISNYIAFQFIWSFKYYYAILHYRYRMPHYKSRHSVLFNTHYITFQIALHFSLHDLLNVTMLHYITDIISQIALHFSLHYLLNITMLHYITDIWCHITSNGAPRISVHYISDYVTFKIVYIPLDNIILHFISNICCHITCHSILRNSIHYISYYIIF